MQTDPGTEGIILAAGSSFRAGTFKPALFLGEMTMVERCIRGMSGICSRIIVVGGHDYERLISIVRGIDGVECVRNGSYEQGMFTSVKAGLSHARGNRCFVLPVDIPLVPRRVYEGLLAVDADIVVPSFNGQNGHPVCCSKGAIARILERPDEATFREAIREIGFRTVEVDAEEILLDVDTPEDVERIRQRLQLK